jgi:hypothetical protein
MTGNNRHPNRDGLRPVLEGYQPLNKGFQPTAPAQAPASRPTPPSGGSAAVRPPAPAAGDKAK